MPVDRARYAPRRRQEGGDDDPLDVGEPEEYTPPATNIGVPSDYTTRVDISSYSDIFGTPGAAGTRGAPGTVERRPLYQEGDELIPANFGPDRIADLQQQLVEVGLLPPNTRLQYRVWDDVSAAAFHQLLAYANQNGLNWATALNKLKSESGGAYEVDENGNLVPVDPNAREKLPTHTTAPEDLRMVFRQAVIETLGEGWSEEQINSAIGAYNQLEIQRQQEAYAAEGTTENITEIPSPEAFITQRAEQSDPGRAQAERGLDYLNQFEDLMGGWRGAGMGTL